MAHARWLALAVTLGFGGVAFAATRPAVDAPVPPGIAPWIEYARERASDPRGLAAIMWPLRFVEARCTPDQDSVMLVFEAANPSTRAYAAILFPAAPEMDMPGATTVLGSISPDEFAAAMAARAYGPCA